VSNTGKQRILISGAGIAGPALAHQLLRYGYKPTLIESAPRLRAGGYMIDIWGTGYELVERYGLLKQVRDRAYIFDRLKFVDTRGHLVSGLGGSVLRRALEGRFLSISRGDLARTIYESIEEKVETLFGTSIRELREDAEGVDVVLTTGNTRRFDVVIGADGLHSQIRAVTFGPETRFERYLGYYAASFIVEGYPHRDESTYLSFAQPGRQISRYAMRDNNSAFLMVFAQNELLAVGAHDLQGQKAVLHDIFWNDGWEAPEILACLDGSDDLYFDAVTQIRMTKWSLGRVALLGDAAYCPSLVAGAGSAFAMLGAYVLAGELHKADGDHMQAFAAYEERLWSFLLRQQNAAVSLARSFTPQTRFGLFLRNRALNIMKIDPIGTWFARRMLGETFPLRRYRR
jgi:2-polyprenyl-6-methoxyphenol hydroxylase-like FAD-dependent oxidoreductase